MTDKLVGSVTSGFKSDSGDFRAVEFREPQDAERGRAVEGEAGRLKVGLDLVAEVAPC